MHAWIPDNGFGQIQASVTLFPDASFMMPGVVCWSGRDHKCALSRLFARLAVVCINSVLSGSAIPSHFQVALSPFLYHVLIPWFLIHRLGMNKKWRDALLAAARNLHQNVLKGRI